MQMNWQNIVTTAEQKFQVRKCDYCNINTLCYSIYLTRLYFALNFFVVSLVCIFQLSKLCLYVPHGHIYMFSSYFYEAGLYFYGAGLLLRSRPISTEQAYFYGVRFFLRSRASSTEQAYFYGAGLTSTEQAYFYRAGLLLRSRAILLRSRANFYGAG
jgi:hypothetical protein